MRVIACVVGAALVGGFAGVARADDKPLDAREPPFAGDYSWIDGNNRQPASLLTAGPLTMSLIVDGYYLYQFRHPADNTVFPSSVAPRHNEISLNMASIGVDVTGLDGPIGRLFLHYASISETLGGQDATTTRGYFLTKPAFQFIQQAAAGWHFHALHGANLELGIMPSPIGVETYITEENWTYLRSFMGEFTPFYFAGVRGQIYPTTNLKLEAWIVNGWQTYGHWQSAPGGVYSLEWRPHERLVLHHDGYFGQDQQTDSTAVRLFSDNYAQVQLLKKQSGVPRSVALATAIDVGYETRSGPADDVMAGGSATGRVEWTNQWMTTLRADFFYDRTQNLIIGLPAGSTYTLPDSRPFFGTGWSATLDFWPAPWIVYRLEAMHRTSTIPYFSGPGGITSALDLRKTDDRIVFNVTLRL